jgi:peptide deformylase
MSKRIKSKRSSWKFDFNKYRTKPEFDPATGRTREVHVLDDAGRRIPVDPFVRKIRVYPDPKLVRPVAIKHRNRDRIRLVLERLVSTARAAEGDGLAANQIEGCEGVYAVVVRVDEEFVELVEPRIVKTSGGGQLSSETCFSVPGIRGDVPRAYSIAVRHVDADTGEVRIRRFFGRSSAVAQHEIDHLDGILFVDRLGLSRLKRQRLLAGIPSFLRAVNRGDKRADEMLARTHGEFAQFRDDAGALQALDEFGPELLS